MDLTYDFIGASKIRDFLNIFADIKILREGKPTENVSGSAPGLSTSPVFANLVLERLGFYNSLKSGNHAICYADDGLIIERSEDEILNSISELESRLAGSGIEFSSEKCLLSEVTGSGLFKMKFLGFTWHEQDGLLVLTTRSGSEMEIGSIWKLEKESLLKGMKASLSKVSSSDVKSGTNNTSGSVRALSAVKAVILEDRRIAKTV